MVQKYTTHTYTKHSRVASLFYFYFVVVNVVVVVVVWYCFCIIILCHYRRDLILIKHMGIFRILGSTHTHTPFFPCLLFSSHSATVNTQCLFHCDISYFSVRLTKILASMPLTPFCTFPSNWLPFFGFPIGNIFISFFSFFNTKLLLHLI